MVAEERLSQEHGRWLIWTGEPEEGKEGGWQYQDFRLQVGVGDQFAGAGGKAWWRHVPDQEVYVERYHNYTGVKVDGMFTRTYTGINGSDLFPPGNLRPTEDGVLFPVYHGWENNPEHPGTSIYGCQHGFFWLPPLAAGFTCEKVVMTWEQTFSFYPIGTTPFGYHTLPLPKPGDVDYADTRIDAHKFQYEFVSGQLRVIELPGFADIVNANRSGGFGIVVGTENISPEFYGYGMPLAVRYLWSQDVFSGWIK